MGETAKIGINLIIAVVIVLFAFSIPGFSFSLKNEADTIISKSKMDSANILIEKNVDTQVELDERPAVSFDDIMGSTYGYKSLYPDWDESADEEYFITANDAGAVVRRAIYDPYTDYDRLASASTAESLNATYYSISADGQYIAYQLNKQKVWRHSYTADYTIFDRGNQIKVDLDLPKDIQLFQWGPTGHALAIVKDFTVHTVENFQDVSGIVQQSEQGERNKHYYGIPDWMNEEEMVGSNSVLYWSPNSQRLAYVYTNDTQVELIEYTWYGNKQYPETIEIAYPKAGTTIGKAEVWVEDIAGGTPRQMLPAPQAWLDGDVDHYFSRFTWRDDNTCLVTWTNRWQNVSIAHLCTTNPEGMFECGTKNAMKEEINGGWVGSFGPFYPMWQTDTEVNYFTIYTRDQGDDDGHWQLAYVAIDQDDPMWMTNTTYDIVELNYYDEANQYIYFTAVYNLPRRRQIMRVKVDARDETNPECMTCGLWDKYPDRCGWVTPVFGREGSFVVINCRGPEVPLTVLINIEGGGNWLIDNINELQMNTDLETAISEVKWPDRRFGTFQSSEYLTKSYQYEVWLPADFDETQNASYPLLIHVYAGPEFQKVTEAYSRGFTQIYMPSMRNMIVASVDGRGSAFEGYKFMREAYLKLGQNEPVDQTNFAKHLIDQFPAIDPTKVALWGWSYGGYTTSHTLGYDAGNTFKCGIAVAPLGDWTWYDAMYAERYMGNINDNSEGYRLASIIRGHDLNNFMKSEYTLIHGTADDNVHFQSAANMEKALVEADVDFHAFSYADEAHSINTAPNANKHIYHQVDIRLSRCLGRVERSYGKPSN